MLLYLKQLLQFRSAQSINLATASSIAQKPTLFIEFTTLGICLLYGFNHACCGKTSIAVFSFLSAGFCIKAIYFTLKQCAYTWVFLGFFTFQTIALGLTAYEFGLRGIVLAFPFAAGIFYFLEFKLATVIAIASSTTTLLASLNALDTDFALRAALALGFSIVFYACLSYVTMRQYKLQRHEASHDFLTKIPNRRGFLTWLEAELARAKKANKNLILYFIDLDKFKFVNDHYGHRTGDLLLRAFALRMLNAIRGRDIIKQGDDIANIGRLSGDEFAFVTYGVEDSNDAKNLAQRLQQVMLQPFFIEQQRLDISISLGFCFAKEVNWNMEMLLETADKRMYEVKQLGRV